MSCFVQHAKKGLRSANRKSKRKDANCYSYSILFSILIYQFCSFHAKSVIVDCAVKKNPNETKEQEFDFSIQFSFLSQKIQPRQIPKSRKNSKCIPAGFCSPQNQIPIIHRSKKKASSDSFSSEAGNYQCLLVTATSKFEIEVTFVAPNERFGKSWRRKVQNCA
jgi:hypothetical protein